MKKFDINRILMLATISLAVIMIAVYAVCKVYDNKKIREYEIQENKDSMTVGEVEREIDIRHEELKNNINKYIPGIVCWGDSLTFGSGGNGVSYPETLSDLITKNILDKYSPIGSEYSGIISPFKYKLTIPVVNMGVGGENTATILGRNGAEPFVIDKDFTIPKGRNSVPISFSNKKGKEIAPLRYGDAGIETVKIDGIEGSISLRESGEGDNLKLSYSFSRSQEGKSKDISAGTEIITDGSENYRDYITVILMGYFGGYDSTSQLISQINSIIDRQTDHKDRYIVLGIPDPNTVGIEQIEDAMRSEYGDKFINLRKYLCTDALSDAGLKPTEDDERLLSMGQVPISLRVREDNVHLNAYGYELVGKKVYERMDELGYFDELKKLIKEANENAF